MTVFESKVIINKPLDEVYSFLADLNNHTRLMPDNVSNVSSTQDEIRFSIQNMVNLALKVSNRIKNESILILPSSEAPFKTELKWTVSDYGHHSTQAVITISAELNMMLKMMASGPLQKLADHQTKQLQIVL